MRPLNLKQTQNPADFIAMRDTELYLIELKSFAARASRNTSFAFSRLTKTQTRGLIKASCYPHIHGIVICKVLTEMGFRVWALRIRDFIDLVLKMGSEGRMSARWDTVQLYATELFREKNGWNIDPIWKMKCEPRPYTNQDIKTLMWTLGKGRYIKAQKRRKVRKS